ncbi:MAG: 3-methyl-2-oxobutanoate hydroxymethyltransferase [Bryobacterales bacterium]|nr:3-methyl-2-oxobutanoate hydroxymethyltransferase [Bryobacterales bacterium]
MSKNSVRLLRIPGIQAKKERGEQIVMLTAYSSWMARLLDESGGVDILLVGDSLGMVELGFDTTIPVTLDDMVRHTRAVRNGAPRAFVVADMPFLSYQTGKKEALRAAARLMQEGGASAVKLEGGAGIAETVHRLVQAGIPVMGHLGLLPQSLHQQGGYRVQAREPDEQEQLLHDAVLLQEAGAFSIVVECIPADVATKVSKTCRIPVIGIGAGAGCDGQVLVTNDLLGLTGDAIPSFAKIYADVGAAVRAAAASFSSEVRAHTFPPAGDRTSG